MHVSDGVQILGSISMADIG